MNSTRKILFGLLAPSVAGLAMLVYATPPAAAHSESLCKLEFLESCKKKKGATHEACVLVAPAACIVHDHASQSQGFAPRKRTKARLKNRRKKKLK